MLAVIYITLGIIFLSVVMLCIRMLVIRNGKFPDIHIGNNRAMRSNGINCATSQDREAQHKAKYQIDTNKL